MRNFSKIILSLCVAASAVNTPIYCEEPVTVSVAQDQNNSQQPQIIQINQQKTAHKKRHLSIFRLWWNTFKYGIGTTLAIGGTALIPVSLAGGVGFISPIPNELKPGCFVATAVSPLLIYLGLKIVQNSYDSCRDELVESYFNISDPDQI